LNLPSTVSSKQPVVRRLLAIAAPITIGRYVGTILRTVENLLVPNRIARYSGSAESGLSQFGALKGMALPLIFFPASFLSALSVLLIPELSSASAAHRDASIGRAVERTLRVTMLTAILIGAVFFVFADNIGILLYNSDEVGLYLRVLAPLTPVMYVESIVDGILKGLGEQMSSLRHSILDSAVRVVLILAVVPRFGMNGFLGIMVISNLLTSSLNTSRLFRVTAIRFQWGAWVFRPLLSVVFAAVITNALLRLPICQTVNGIIATITGTIGMCLLYVFALFLTGSIRLSDFRKHAE
jgi:stage V sporulation protein B